MARPPLWTACLLLFGFLGCASTGEPEEEPLPVAVIETFRELRLSSPDEGLTREVRVEMRVESLEPGVYQLLGRGRRLKVDDAMLQVNVRWRDFVGLSPTSYGGRRSWPLEFGEDGLMERGLPLVREVPIELDEPQERVLARQVTVSMRLHPVDVVGEEVRSGGARMEFPPARIDSYRRQPEGELLPYLLSPEERDPSELFLRAVAVPEAKREEHLELLIGHLSKLDGADREAAFGALHFLTGETHGRQVYAWETWLTLRKRAQGRAEAETAAPGGSDGP